VVDLPEHEERIFGSRPLVWWKIFSGDARFSLNFWPGGRTTRGMYVREKTARGHTYLYLVASEREGCRVRQRIIRALDRKDVLRASGELDHLADPGRDARYRAMGIPTAIGVASFRIRTRRTDVRPIISRLAISRLLIPLANSRSTSALCALTVAGRP
jgi:hypothetical protein